MPDGTQPDLHLSNELQNYYAVYSEDRRLTAGAGLVEAARTREIIGRWLKPPPTVVFDVGGGPGAYALWLAREGYDVHLIDPVSLHIEHALRASAGQTEHLLASVAIGDARHLEYRNGVADAVLLLGPLYHLTRRTDRMLALREARRVLVDGGLVIAAAISRFASTLDGIWRDLLADPEFEKIVVRDLDDGQHRNSTNNRSYFTTAFFHHPDELRAEVEDAGFQLEAILAVEGPGWLLHDLDAFWADKNRRFRLLEALRRIEDEPSLLGASAHLLAVGRKPASL